MNTLVLLALIAFVTIASAADACSAELMCLSSNSAASSHCSVVLDPYTPATSTTTKTVTTGAKGSQVTVTLTTIKSVFVTEGATSTSYATSVSPTTVRTTITTYVSESVNAKRAEGSCDSTAALSSLSELNREELSTACSCLDAVPTPSTMTTGKAVTATVTRAAPATVTSIMTGEVHFTVAPSLIIPTTIISSSVTTTTVSLAAPSFTQVFGPEAGCVDMKPLHIDSLEPEVGKAEAVDTCQGHCAQNSNCSFVYVQFSLENYSPDVKPFFMCYYNNHTLDAASDIQCGSNAGLWGMAEGYNAIGRGE